MTNPDDKIWEKLKAYKVSQAKEGYISRFWTNVSHKKTVFIPRPWAFASLALSVFLIFGFFASTGYQTTVTDAEIARNFELAKHWQGIEHVDVVSDLDIIEQVDFKQDSSI